MRAFVIGQSILTLLVVGYVGWSSSHPGPAPAAQAEPGDAAHGSAAETHGAADGGHEALTPDAVVARLMEGNARFVAGKPNARALVEAREKLASGQSPAAIVLSCSDSRVPPELVFDQSLGDLFVVRVAGNVADKNALGSIEYAAEHLHAGVVIVLGHEKCGAVTAAATGEKMPSPNLQSLVDEIAPGLPKREPKPSPELVHAGVEANVNATAAELLSRSTVLSEHAAQGKLKVVRAVYTLDTGAVRLLP